MATVLKGRFVLNSLFLNSARNCLRPVFCSLSDSSSNDVESNNKELKVVYELQEVNMTVLPVVNIEVNIYTDILPHITFVVF